MTGPTVTVMWRTRPFVRILFFFLAGIFTAIHVPALQQLPAIYFLLLTGFFLVLLLGVYRFIKSFALRWLPGLMAGLVFVFAGISMTLLQFEKQETPLPEKGKVVLAGEIVSEPQPTKKSVKFIFNPRYDSLKTIYRSGNIMVFLKKEPKAQSLRMGDFIVVQGNLSTPGAPLNPEEFDYAFYLKTQRINRILFVPEQGWQPIQTTKANNIKTLFARWRNYLLNTLQENGLSGEEYSVAAAILLGNDQLIDPDTQQNYVAAGAVHILCVSGMHVGIIFLVLTFVLGFLNKLKKGILIKNLLLFLLLWSYALLTGLSPSVLRATVMISFFILANALKRDYDSYNLLAASAFVLLLFNPFLIFHVGFQLSYSAVLGILTFYYPLYRSIYIKNKIATVFWAALMVSLSAQLGAFPIAAHYFHVFPVYFLLTNLIIFVLSYLILSLGFGLLLLSWLPLVPRLLGIVLSFTIKILNLWVQFVAHIPFSQLSDLYFSWPTVTLIYLLVLFVFLFLFKRKWGLVLPALTVAFLLLALQTFRNIELQSQKHIIIYAVNQHPVIGLIEGRSQILLTDSTAVAQPGLLNYNLGNYRISRGLRNETKKISGDDSGDEIYYRNGFLQFNGNHYYILNTKQQDYPSLSDKIHLTAVICTGTTYVPLQNLSRSFAFNTVIVDQSVPYWVQDKIRKEAKQLNMKALELQQTGAVRINKKNQIFLTNSLQN